VRLFPDGEPAEPHTFIEDASGAPIGIRFEGDLDAFVSLMAQVSGLNMIVEAGATAAVRFAARDAPWDGVLIEALRQAGVELRLEPALGGVSPEGASEQQIARVFAAGRADDLVSPPRQEPGADLVSLMLTAADMDDLARLFAEISGLGVEIPEGAHPPVTVFFADTPWNAVFAWIAAVQGWTASVEGETLRAAAPPGR
jgi:hypothetical protein